MAASKNFVVEQGKTFSQVLRWETTPYVYKAISAITNAAPCRVTSSLHGIPEGWRCAVVSVKGMTDINAANTPPKDKDYHAVHVVDANTVEFNDINSSDFKVYTSGGYLQFYTPVDLSGFTARMAVKDKVGGTVLVTLTTENGGITLDTVNKKITLTISATDTAAFSWKTGVYDLEMVSPAGVVTALVSGKVTVTQEVTT